MHKGMVTETEVNSMVQNQQDPKSCDLEPEVAKRNESDVEPDPGTSSQGDAVCTKDLKSQSLAATTIEGESLSDLRKALSSNPDIGPKIQGMLQSKRPSTQEMVTNSPACRHYWVLWDSLVVKKEIPFKNFKRKMVQVNICNYLSRNV